jgi:hypothetical protein
MSTEPLLEKGMKMHRQVYIFGIFSLGLCCCQSNDRRVSQLSNTVDSLTRKIDSLRMKLPVDTDGISSESHKNSAILYQLKVFTFCVIRYMYTKELPAHYETRRVLIESQYTDPYFKDEQILVPAKDTTLFRSAISEIHEIDNNPDSRFRLLDQFEKELLEPTPFNNRSSLTILSRTPLSFTSYAEASQKREDLDRKGSIK